MATNTNNICVGAATVSIGAYVSAGGAVTLTDVGHTKEPPTLQPAFENYGVTSERAFGTLRKIPVSGKWQLTVPMLEATIENYRISCKQGSGSTTGTSPNLTLRVGQFAEQYHQITLAVPGVGSTAARTITLWRCDVESLDAISFGKTIEQVLKPTFDVNYDDTVTTADKFFKIVDA